MQNIEETNHNFTKLLAYFEAGELSRKELIVRVYRLILMMEEV